MTAIEIKLARSIAMDTSVDLSRADDSPLFGFGLRDFVPVTVSVYAVAKCMRWQCQCFNGSWDERQYNEDLPSYRKRIQVAELTASDAAGQAEFGFASVMRQAVTQWTWYSKGGFKLLAAGETDYVAWLAFFTPLSRGGR